MLAIRRFLVTSLLFFVIPAFAFASTWPHLRGPNLDGHVTTDGLFDRENLALELAWNAELGPAYSGISIADGVLVTFYADDESDRVVGMNADDGTVLWTHRIDSVYRGHDGSSDGPLSTPVIHDGMVYGLGARGQLFALRLSDGQPQWLRQLKASYGAEEPHFGFTSTPVVADGVLIVQSGGTEGRSIVGIDRKTGDTLWTRGDGKIDYQSPTLLNLAGRNHLVAVAGRQILGLAPGSGEILWQHELAEEDRANSAHPTAAGENRFLVFVSGEATVFELAQADSGFELSEVFRSRELGQTYALPVYHDGYLYGFRGQFLTCIDATNGEKIWKSRPPGGRGLILVDDRLVIFGSQGNVVVAEATPEGYRETARVQALEGSAYTWPSFAGDRIYVRNLEEIAAVTVASGTSMASDDTVPDHAFGRFVRELASAGDKDKLVEAFLTKHDTFPIVDGQYVHFVFHGEAEDVAMEGNLIDDGTDGLQRVEGTDFYHRTYELEPGTRWEYRFVKDLSERVTDPRNPRTVPARRGDVGYSEVVLAGYEAPDHVAEPSEGTRRGTVETLTFQSETFDDEREIRVYLPAGYEKGDGTYPLFLVHGLEWAEQGRMVHTLDNLTGRDIAPVVVAFVAPRRQWWMEGGGSATREYVDMLANELVPFLAGKFRLTDSPKERALMGAEGFGLTAALGGLKRPDVFGKVAACSVHLGAGHGDALMELVDQPERADVEFFVGWHRWDVRRHAGGMDYRGDSMKLAEALEARGYPVAGGENRDAHGWGGAWSITDDILESLFPLGSRDTAGSAGSE